MRDRIVRTAAALFYVDGLRGVGVNRIIEEAEVAKATFYRHFPSKEHLVLAYLDEMDRLWKIELRRAAGQETDTSADRLTAMFDALLWEGHPGEYRERRSRRRPQRPARAAPCTQGLQSTGPAYWSGSAS
ncbi:TetR/AcrR family transcriptional regulator [Arthrobacter sp. QXT-31]|uniref:TetR/AcrR family transcriptional regulator n=1 Tax=Arthrobacter sp. QXT-31 TaxID=1357915 RepID=UPI0009FB5D78|nr:TetR/AcrR family transcriptional regulator [Arthrobacter sp. QXT-31]